MRSRAVVVLVVLVVLVGIAQAAVLSSHTTDTDFNAGTVNRPLAVTGTGTSASVTYNDTLDSFEDGSLSEYGGNLTSYSTPTNFPQDGSNSLKGEVVTGASRISTTDTQLTTDERYRVWVRPDTVAATSFAFFTQSENELANAYLLQLDITNNAIKLFDYDGSFNQLASDAVTINTDTDYQIEVVKHSGNNTVEFLLLDDGGTELARASVADASYSSGGWGFRTVNGIVYYDDVRTHAPDDGIYISANHTAAGSEGGFVNITELSNAEVTVTWETSDGGEWSTLNQTSGITTTANHTFDWATETNSTVRVNVTVINQTANGEPVFAMASEGVTEEDAPTPTPTATATPAAAAEGGNPLFDVFVLADDLNADLVTIESVTTGFALLVGLLLAVTLWAAIKLRSIIAGTLWLFMLFTLVLAILVDTSLVYFWVAVPLYAVGLVLAIMEAGR